ncbi:MAG: biotin--[acetyl-CoA-carboxylase] ligase [Pyrinomonadaceae bacterium]
MGKLGQQILRFDSLPSTNLELAKRAAEGAPEGLCVVSREQTAGRGRLQRHWISPKDAGLYFSVLLRPKIAHNAWPLITLSAAVAVHDALLHACALKTDIKWPNDVMADNRKLCGILAETVETKVGRAVVLGIGINLTDSALPPDLEETASSVEAASGVPPDLEVVLSALILEVDRRYLMLQSPKGTEETIRAWGERSSYVEGKRIILSNGSEILEGTSRGLEIDGALRLETETGEIRIVRTGDLTIRSVVKG